MTLPSKSAKEVRQTFLEYFQKRDHLYVEPAGVIPKNDPTLMFINSGMAPMKPFFTAQAEPPYPRLTNVQDCIRFVDIDSIGDSYHGTSFRMMGSWSFGDYFKERAIELAFDLITNYFSIPKERLFATVFVADDSLLGVPSDEESARIWEKFLPKDHIIGRPPIDNFWGPAGTSGPCGPCTEVFFDRGESFAEVETDDPLVPGRHVEIWNAGVFMQYYMNDKGEFSELPLRCVDTGAGLERFAMILQNCSSIHEIDQYMSCYEAISSEIKDTTWSRIILDHLKTSILMMREGVAPSNIREGYLLRRALRRAMIGIFLRDIRMMAINEWVELLSDVIDNKELTYHSKQEITRIIKKECDSFENLMRRSDKYLNKIVAKNELTAQQAFTLKTGVGIPEDLLEEFSKRHGIKFPREEFVSLIEEHRKISRQQKK